MWVYDLDSLAFLDVNDAAIEHYGYSRAEFLTMTIADIRPDEDLEALRESVRNTALIDRSGPWRHRIHDGTLIEVEVTSHITTFDGRPARFVMVDDITARRVHEAELRRRALYDELTGLSNRTLLLDRLNRAIESTDGTSEVVAVLLLDLDRFKLVNNGHGHAVGDRLLQRIAVRLQEAVGPENSVGRIGSDEFVVVCEEMSTDAAALAAAARIEAALSEPFEVDGVEVFAPASIGVAVADSGTTGEELLRDALTALTQAKERGRARVEVYDVGMHSGAVSRLQTDRDLRHALDRDELRLHYQPEIDLRTGALVGAEALVRWAHPERGLVGPADFISVAEETGLIVPIGAWVLTEALRQLRGWQREGTGPPVVSVNVSVRQLGQPDFADEVRRAVEGAGIGPDALCIEITESSLLEARTIATLRRIHAMGVRLSLDDFGTGYSSLVYLRRFPLDFLKIDRQFVAGLSPQSQDTSIVSAMIDLAHALGLTVVAEGVETEEQAALLQELGCDLGQGYLWSPAVPAGELGDSISPTRR
ncbi:MAG: EAL domain-containing protein [Actinobacteria bacterium]|nr:EAL domain-containing protein [Actinomycetota bacterium]